MKHAINSSNFRNAVPLCKRKTKTNKQTNQQKREIKLATDFNSKPFTNVQHFALSTHFALVIKSDKKSLTTRKNYLEKCEFDQRREL